MYSIADFGRMIDDDVRTGAYARALEQTVRDGSVVLDIGTGIGIFAMLACRYGAQKVYAVDPSKSIEVGREIARDNGFADRIHFLQSRSQDVELPEQVDVIVSDIRGILPYCGPSISAIADARSRFLKPGGVLIPLVDEVWLAPVEAGELYHRYEHPWVENPFGFDLSAGHRFVVNEWRHARSEPEGFLADPTHFTTVDYRTISHSNVQATLDLPARRSGLLHGYNVWFETTLYPGIGYSTSPLEEERIYQSAFFPIERETEVGKGDTIHLHISANLIHGDYLWRWKTRVTTENGVEKAAFDQSTFQNMPLPAEIGPSSAQAADLGPGTEDVGRGTWDVGR